MTPPLLLSPGVVEYHRKLAHDDTATAAELGCGLRAMVAHADALMEIARRVAEYGAGRDDDGRCGACGDYNCKPETCPVAACKSLVTP